MPRTIQERLRSAQEVALLFHDVLASEGDLLRLPRVCAVLPVKCEKLDTLQQILATHERRSGMQRELLCWQQIQVQVFIHRFIGAIAATAVYSQLPDVSLLARKARL